jgi:hypothetical protein
MELRDHYATSRVGEISRRNAGDFFWLSAIIRFFPTRNTIRIELASVGAILYSGVRTTKVRGNTNY